MTEILFIFLNICFGVYLVYYIVAFISGAPFVPSTNTTASTMITLAGLKKGETAYDLGSGEGKLLKLIAQQGAQAIGIEINPLLVVYTKIRFLFSPYRKLITIYAKSFWSVDLKSADVIFVYLLPLRMEKLEKKLLRECKKGTRVVSNSFLFPHWKLTASDEKQHVYVYKIP